MREEMMVDRAEEERPAHVGTECAEEPDSGDAPAILGEAPADGHRQHDGEQPEQRRSPPEHGDQCLALIRGDAGEPGDGRIEERVQCQPGCAMPAGIVGVAVDRWHVRVVPQALLHTVELVQRIVLAQRVAPLRRRDGQTPQQRAGQQAEHHQCPRAHFGAAQQGRGRDSCRGSSHAGHAGRPGGGFHSGVRHAGHSGRRHRIFPCENAGILYVGQPDTSRESVGGERKI